jgi:hypothetical protein
LPEKAAEEIPDLSHTSQKIIEKGAFAETG